MGTLSESDIGGFSSSFEVNHSDLINIFYHNFLEVNHLFYGPNALSYIPMPDLDSTKGDSDPKTREAIARAISIARAYSNLGDALAAKA